MESKFPKIHPKNFKQGARVRREGAGFAFDAPDSSPSYEHPSYPLSISVVHFQRTTQ